MRHCMAKFLPSSRHFPSLVVVQVAATRPVELTAEKQVDEAVFQQAFIARKLEEVDHIERDSQRLLEGKSKDLYFTTLTGMAPDGTGAGSKPKVLLASQKCDALPQTNSGGINAGATQAVQESQCTSALPDAVQQRSESGQNTSTDECAEELCAINEDGREGADTESQASDATDVEEGEWCERSKLSPEKVREARKANKQAVKAQQREKRLTKVPKKVKKRAEKKGKVTK